MFRNYVIAPPDDLVRRIGLCSTTRPMSEAYLPDRLISDTEPAFINAREAVCAEIKDMNLDRRAVDSSVYELLEHPKPHFVFPKLTGDEDAEKFALIEVHLRAAVNFETGTLYAPNGRADISYVIDVNASEEIISRISRTYQLRIVRMAYAEKLNQIGQVLNKKMRRDEITPFDCAQQVERRRKSLEKRCQRAIQELFT